MQERRMESGLEFAGGWVRIDGQGREQFAMFDLVFFFFLGASAVEGLKRGLAERMLGRLADYGGWVRGCLFVARLVSPRRRSIVKVVRRILGLCGESRYRCETSSTGRRAFGQPSCRGWEPDDVDAGLTKIGR